MCFSKCSSCSQLRNMSDSLHRRNLHCKGTCIVCPVIVMFSLRELTCFWRLARPFPVLLCGPLRELHLFQPGKPGKPCAQHPADRDPLFHPALLCLCLLQKKKKNMAEKITLCVFVFAHEPIGLYWRKHIKAVSQMCLPTLRSMSRCFRRFQ